MATFSPTDAAFEGFRITRDKPAALAIWAIASLAAGVVMALAMIAFFGPVLMELQDPPDDPERAMELTRQLAPFYALMAPLGLVIMSVWAAAVYRVVLRPQDRGLGYMKLGGDELRLALLAVIYVLLAMGFFFAVVLVVGVLAGVAAAVAGPFGAVVGVLLGLAVFPLFVWVSVRLSLAGPMTFAERRLRVFASWRLTKGHFWPLLGAYALSLVMMFLIAALGLVLYAVIAVVLTGGNFAAAGRVFEPDMSSIAAYFTPSLLVYMVFGSFLGAVQYALIYAPGAVAYRDLAQVGVEDTFA